MFHFLKHHKDIYKGKQTGRIHIIQIVKATHTSLEVLLGSVLLEQIELMVPRKSHLGLFA